MPPPDRTSSQHPPLRICIVDDRPEIRDLIKLILFANGRDITQAGSAPDARQRIADSHPHLVLLDAMLPDGQSGFDLCREIKGLADAPVVVMMSAQSDHQAVSQAREAGADGFVAKPFSPATLRQLIDPVEEWREDRSRDFAGVWPDN